MHKPSLTSQTQGSSLMRKYLLIKSETSVNYLLTFLGFFYIYIKKVLNDIVLMGIIWFLNDRSEVCFTLSLR